jgi:hypothetical protein
MSARKKSSKHEVKTGLSNDELSAHKEALKLTSNKIKNHHLSIFLYKI